MKLPLEVMIRDVRVAPALVLAPMEGVTDVTFRRLIRQIGGCGMTVTEFIPARSLIGGVPQFVRMAAFDEDEHPISIQIYGNDPEMMARAARVAQDRGADVLDLNMGCPSKKVCKNSGGSALMKDPELSRRIIAAMRAAVSIPFTVKMRAGWDREHRNAVEMAQMCEEEGVEAVAVHWRTRAEGYGGERNLDTIRDVVDRLTIPVLANGDVLDVATARETLEATGCAGLMIGRGAIRNPWVFQQIAADLRGEVVPEVSLDERERVLLGYYAAIRTLFQNDRGALGRMKKIARYFTDGVPNGAVLRQAIFHSHTVDEAYERVRGFFDTLREREAEGGLDALPVSTSRVLRTG